MLRGVLKVEGDIIVAIIRKLARSGKFILQCKAIASLESLNPLWQEIDIYEPLPGFSPKEYYTNYSPFAQISESFGIIIAKQLIA